MGYEFHRNSPVHDLRPWAHVKPGMRQHILWPAWRYKVVAPEVRDRKINILQKAVLGMCRCGITYAADIAELLRIHRDLAARVVLELQFRKLIGYDGHPTEKGVLTLEEDIISDDSPTVGFVFQDPWSRRVWPRFVEHNKLDYADLRYQENGYPELVSGTKGRPVVRSAYMHIPKDGPSPTTPDAKEILEAVTRSRRALRHVDYFENWDDREEVAISKVRVDRVSMIEDVPQACFLHTYLYIPAEGRDGSDWHVCDPFGLGMSMPLRKQIENQMLSNPGLQSVLERLIGGRFHAQVEEQIKWNREMRDMARLEVDRILTLNASELPFYEKFLEMECSNQEVIYLDECPTYKLRGALNSARQVLEGSFADIASRHPNKDVWRYLYVDDRKWHCDDYVRKIYEQAASSVGLDRPLPPGFMSVKAGNVRAAVLSQSSWRLRPLIIGTMLAASQDPEHPMRRAAALNPGLLSDLDQIIRAGGDASHYVETGKVSLSRSEVQDVVRKVYKVVAQLYDLPISEH